ncbi:MAG: hypothetical protein EAZ84_13800, partial [Verrucomicrobia bacterium]
MTSSPPSHTFSLRATLLLPRFARGLPPRVVARKHLCRRGTGAGFSGKGFLCYCRRREELRDPFLQSRCHHFRGLPGEKRSGHPLPHLGHSATAGAAQNPDQPFDYFDELMPRIQDIRTSERRFYQKITDIYANEADLLNVALFGQAAKQWRDAHPDAEGNVWIGRDRDRLLA